jgi:hypothetical protein
MLETHLGGGNNDLIFLSLDILSRRSVKAGWWNTNRTYLVQGSIVDVCVDCDCLEAHLPKLCSLKSIDKRVQQEAMSTIHLFFLEFVQRRENEHHLLRVVH